MQLQPTQFLTVVALLIALTGGSTWAKSVDDVSVEIINDNGRSLQQYPVRQRNPDTVYRAYLAAERGAGYAITPH